MADGDMTLAEVVEAAKKLAKAKSDASKAEDRAKASRFREDGRGLEIIRRE